MSRRYQNSTSRQRLPTIREDKSSSFRSEPPKLAQSAWTRGPPRPAGTGIPPAHVKPMPAPQISPAPVPLVVSPAVFEPWPETDDFGSVPLAQESSKPSLSDDEIVRLGDKILSLILSEVEMHRGLSVKVPQTYVRVYPSPPYERALYTYVVDKAKARAIAERVDWTYGRDVITIVF